MNGNLEKQAKSIISDKLESANLKHLPNMIRYLLQNSAKEELSSLVGVLRKKLVFTDVKDKSEEEKKQLDQETLRKYEEESKVELPETKISGVQLIKVPCRG